MKKEDYYPVYVSLCGDFAFIYWLIVGDAFDVTKGNLSPIVGAVQQLDAQSKSLLTKIGRLLDVRHYEGLSFKKNAGKFVGSVNYMRLKNITRRADALLLSALGIPKKIIIEVFDWYVRILSINENMGEKGIPSILKEKYPPKRFDIEEQDALFDEIDKVLAKHYGFTEEELDFIINYDIKYRMGDELNEE